MDKAVPVHDGINKKEHCEKLTYTDPERKCGKCIRIYDIIEE